MKKFYRFINDPKVIERFTNRFDDNENFVKFVNSIPYGMFSPIVKAGDSCQFDRFEDINGEIWDLNGAVLKFGLDDRCALILFKTELNEYFTVVDHPSVTSITPEISFEGVIAYKGTVTLTVSNEEERKAAMDFLDKATFA